MSFAISRSTFFSLQNVEDRARTADRLFSQQQPRIRYIRSKFWKFWKNQNFENTFFLKFLKKKLNFEKIKNFENFEKIQILGIL